MNDERPEHLAELIVDASDREPDLLWASGFLAVDAFTWLRDSTGSAILLTDLELGRGEKEACVDEVVSLSAMERAAKEAQNVESVPFEGVVLHWLKSRGIEGVRVPYRFPLLLADHLRRGGPQVHGVRLARAPLDDGRLRRFQRSRHARRGVNRRQFDG